MRPRLHSDVLRTAIRAAPINDTVLDVSAESIPVDLEDEDRPTDPDGFARERAMALLGRVISERYRIDDLLGMGGMGAVYRGYHLLLHKQVAIKVLHANIKNLPELVARFDREAIAGAHVVHPNVAAATDLGKLDDGSHFLVLEYVPGETLHDLIHRERLSVARAVHIARQIASALAATHARGIVHRDLKPSNVMLAAGPGDVAKLIDFGLAKVPVDQVTGAPAPAGPAAAGARITGMGVIFGTVAYLAPEAAGGMDCVDARADLYALGVILYQMLAGRHPFNAVKSVELFAQHRFEAPPPLLEAAPHVPPELAAIVMRLLAKDPAARHASCTELIAAPDALGLEPPRPGSERPPVPPADVARERTSPVVAPRAPSGAPARARRSIPLTLALATLALLAATGMYFWGTGISTPAVASPPVPPSAALPSQPPSSPAP